MTETKKGAAGPRDVPGEGHGAGRDVTAALATPIPSTRQLSSLFPPDPAPSFLPLPIRIREVLPQEQEINYIVKTWAREFRDFIPAHMPERLYYAKQQKVIGDLASKSTMRLAVNPDDIAAIYGFAVGKVLSPTTLLLHFVYVRREWQRLGVATELIKALGYAPPMEILATHWSHHISRWMEPPFDRRVRTASGNLKRSIKFPFIVYDPYLLHGGAQRPGDVR